MQTTEIEVGTGRQPGVADLTDACSAFARESSGGGSGLLHVFVPHATAGLVVIELGSGSEPDLLETVERLLPHDERWRHRHGTTGHGADHVLPLLAPPSLSLPVIDGRLQLGTWQSVVLVDTNRDNRRRRVRLSFLAG
jgi:secondary thiamine-phosphate synthase enzyme